MINYVIFLRLAPAFAENLTRPGVMDAVAEAAGSGRAPGPPPLTALGLPEEFVTLFVKRMNYLLALRQSGVLRSAGPFSNMSDGIYVCNVSDEQQARRILEEDPLYQAGFIERDY